MLRDVIRAIDYSDCAEIALALFCFAFALMVFATMRLSSRATHRFASIPLADTVVTADDAPAEETSDNE